MPEYLAPGVFVEEISFRAKTSKASRPRPPASSARRASARCSLEPDIVTSLGEFEQVYGRRRRARIRDARRHARISCGTRCAPSSPKAASGSTSRACSSRCKATRADCDADDENGTHADNGRPTSARATSTASARRPTRAPAGIAIRARHPGAIGNCACSLTLKARANMLGSTVDPDTGERATLGALADRDLVWIRDAGSPPGADGRRVLRRAVERGRRGLASSSRCRPARRRRTAATAADIDSLSSNQRRARTSGDRCGW